MSTVVKDLGAVSAYAYAVEKGYTGTEAEFAELMADYAEVGQRAEDAADSALESKTAAQTAATTATNKAGEATTAAQTATTKAGEASQSASQASASAQTASTKASEASASATTASAKATEATTAAGTATTAKNDAVAAKTAAETAQTAAETAQEAAEDAAESVSASAAQIATNTADISDIKEDLSDVKSGLNAKIDAIENGITVTSSGETSLYLKSGDTVTVDVKSITGSVNMYISGYSSTNVKILSQVQKVEYTAANDGKLRFYFINNATMTAVVTLNTVVSKAVAELQENTVGLTYLGIIPLELGDFDSGTGAKVTNTNRLTSADFLDQSVLKITYNSAYYAYVYAYTRDGVYVGSYTGSGFSTNWADKMKMSSPINMETFGEYDYVYNITFARTDGSASSVETLEMSVLFSVVKNLSVYGEEIYTVGADGDYQTFTDMLIGLADNTNRKTVYVQSGVYNIFDEMGGAEYVASLDAKNLNWRDVCHVVPPNTTIIGKGEVILEWNPTDAEIIDQDHAFLLSPLNVSGSCTIKNIKIHCSNCRYGIHDESSGRSIYDGIVREFENVEVIFTASTYGVKYAYGAGHNKNSKFVFKNCLFSANFADSWSSHDWPTSDSHENSEFSFENCVFINNINNSNGGIRFETADASGRLDNVKIVACVFGRITFGSGTANSKQGYDVTTMLCKPYSILYSTNIAEADRIAPKDYLILP